MCRKAMPGVWSSVCVDDMDGSADGLDTLRHDGQVNVTVLCMTEPVSTSMVLCVGYMRSTHTYLISGSYRRTMHIYIFK